MADITVFQFKEGITEESDYSDEDYRIGTMDFIQSRNGLKARLERITWMETDRVEYINTGLLRKVDKDLYVMETPWNGSESGHLPQMVQRMRDLANRATTANQTN